MRRVKNKIISGAMYELARTIQCDDGACNEAALRLDEQHLALLAIRNATSENDMRRIATEATTLDD